MKNLYDVLGVQPSADAADIRSKYRQAALRIHPDKGGSSEAFHLLTFAFEVLSCPFARAAYDKNCKQPTPQHGDSPAQTPRPNKSTPVSVSFNLKKAKFAATARRPSRWQASACSKRPAAVDNTKPPKKRQRTQQHCHIDSTRLRERIACTSIPLSQIRDVLQCMTADQRQFAVRMLTPRVQAALVMFMETLKKHPIAPFAPKSRRSPVASVPKQSAVSRIVTSPNAAFNNDAKFNAHMHIKALRFYTRGHVDLEVALERQIVLVQLCQALSAAGTKNPIFWEDASQTYQVCLDVLRANNTSEEKLGLSAYIYMRAGHWLLQSCTIISPVMPLSEAVALHCRLLRARETSWKQLRAEWVQLMQCARHPAAKRKPLHEAEAIADAARASALKIQLARAVISANKALEIEDLRAIHRRRVETRRNAREERAAARAKSATMVAQKRIAKTRLEARKELRRWERKSDLTMDNIMHGHPSRAVVGGS